MTLLEQITNDMKEAMKAKDEAKLSTLRMLKSALKNKQIDKRNDLTDEDVLSVIKTQIKQLKDSLESFTQAARDDLAQAAKNELAILETYMPAQMGDEELETLVKETLAEIGAQTKSDMGKAMGAVMKKVGSQADGNRVKEIVGNLLAVVVFTVVATVAFPEMVLAASDANTFIVPALRIARIFLLLFGVVSLNMILVGGFTYMVASGRDEAHSNAIEKISKGLLGTILIASLFTIATIALQNLTA